MSNPVFVEIEAHIESRKMLYSFAASEFMQSSISNQGRIPLHTPSALLQTESVKIPPFADSVSEGDVKFTVKVGIFVKPDEIVIKIETDKTSVGIPAPFGGVIEKNLVADGDTVKAEQELFVLKKSDASAALAAKPAAAAEPPSPPPASKPAAVAYHQLQINCCYSSSTSTNCCCPNCSCCYQTCSRNRVYQNPRRVKISRMMQKIYQRLKDAQNVNVMLTTFNEMDMSGAMEITKPTSAL
uniref:Lipoyl-binding domain-containing protein n=1 Tax=Megaselia scalaris TaxID=36166 RepID=T1GG98_MEGSC